MIKQIRCPARPNPVVDNETIRSAIKDHNYSLMSFADEMGICYHTLRNRLATGTWTALEAHIICSTLDLNMIDVFQAHPDKYVPDGKIYQ